MRNHQERWQALEARLGRELNIFLATVRKDGRPHLVPVWFVWLEEKLYFATCARSQKYVNLRGNQRVALTLPDPEQVVIVEGEAHACTRAVTQTLADYFFHKYEWDFRFDDSCDWRLVEVTPLRIMMWGDGLEEEGIRLL